MYWIFTLTPMPLVFLFMETPTMTFTGRHFHYWHFFKTSLISNIFLSFFFLIFQICKTTVSPLGTRDISSYQNYLLNMPRTMRLEIRCIIRICINLELLVATFAPSLVNMWIVIQFLSRCTDIHARGLLTFCHTPRRDVSFNWISIFLIYKNILN